MNDNLQNSNGFLNDESQADEFLQNNITTFNERSTSNLEENAYEKNLNLSTEVLNDSIAIAKDLLNQFDAKDGQIQQILTHCKQSQGIKGETYVPKISENGYLSWMCSDSKAILPKEIKVVGERGATGATGASGRDGVNGRDGINGKDGTNGINGVTPNITLSAVLTADSEPRVVKSGTIANPNFQLYIPKGEKGDIGEKGEDFKIDGTCMSTSQLPSGKPNGTIYMVGGIGEYDLYLYESIKNQWTNIGQLKGEKGDNGERGTDGVNGTDGISPNITLSAISTSSSIPSVTRTGTFPNYNYQLTIPKGAKGDTGSTGATPNITMTAISTTSTTPSVTKTGTTTNPIFNLAIPKGADGVTPNISIKAESTSSSVPSVTKSGTNANPTFTFSIPKGEKGDKGAPGAAESKALLIGNFNISVDNNPNNIAEINLDNELQVIIDGEITSTLLVNIVGEYGSLMFIHDLEFSQNNIYFDAGSQIVAEFSDIGTPIVTLSSMSSQIIKQITVKCL